MMKKLMMVSLLIMGLDLVASNDHCGGFELAPRLDSVLESNRDNSVPSLFGADQNICGSEGLAFCAEGCAEGLRSENGIKAAGGCCLVTCIIAASITFGIVFQPTYTHVTNFTPDVVELRYPNGCSCKDSKGKSHACDCYKTLYPDDRTTIQSSGKLDHLCADMVYHFDPEKCATRKALQQCNDFGITKRHNHLVFGRLCDSGSSSSTNSSAVANFIEQSKRQTLAQKRMVREVKQQSGHKNLRGSFAR